MQVRVNLSTPTYFFAVCQKHGSKVKLDVELGFDKGVPIGGEIAPMQCQGGAGCQSDWVLEVNASTSDIVVTL